MRPVGFLINPVAGMGGRPGLKGTDGLSLVALSKGALPSAGGRAMATLRPLAGSNVPFLTCSGPMGEEVMRASAITRY